MVMLSYTKVYTISYDTFVSVIRDIVQNDIPTLLYMIYITSPVLSITHDTRDNTFVGYYNWSYVNGN
jgi:hypothetical protein